MKSDRSLLTTLILFFFFGWISAHRFYVGKNVSALIYL
ncbi:MAG: TM2 domain-containing protein [Spirochaetota bacterium]|nr:TM2 domain-containing protein [Spirochaetota bacterium]